MYNHKTKKELYAKAKTLQIAGRSKMDKAELDAAITAHIAAMNKLETDQEKEKAYLAFMELSKPESSAEGVIVKRIQGVQRYFQLGESSYSLLGSTDRFYTVHLTERVFCPSLGGGAYPFVANMAYTTEDYIAQQEELKALLLDEVMDFINESKDHGQTYMDFDYRMSAEEAEEEPVLKEGHTDNLLYETPYKRVWRSRMTVEDGAEADHQITVEHWNADTHKFETVLTYTPPQTKVRRA